MNPFETAEAVQASRANGEDRVGVVRFEERLVIVVADGAGGTSGGAAAATFVVEQVRTRAAGCHTPEEWSELLARLDLELPAGEAAAVVVDLTAEGIVGASVGDCRAWVIAALDHDEGTITDLSVQQVRKPLLGSRAARADGFQSAPLRATLIVATDGLFNYAKAENMAALVATTEFYSLPRRLIESVRLPSGDYWDDIGIVACRPTPLRRTHQRYTID